MATLDAQEWWTLAELAERWKASVDVIRKRVKLKPTDPHFIRSMGAGVTGKKYLIHRDEIARLESVALPAESKPVVVKPVKPSKPAAAFVLPSFELKRQQIRQRKLQEAKACA